MLPASNLVPSLRLSNGESIPVIGMGTSRIGIGAEVVRALKMATDVGYRHFDSAERYMNEKAIGSALEEVLRTGQVRRAELTICSKIWSNNHTAERALEAVRNSLANLRTDYLDLALIHWPFSFLLGPDQMPTSTGNTLIGAAQDEANFLLAYRGLEKAHDLGLVRSLGVCNFTIEQLIRLLDKARTKPVINQVECHPFLTQQKLLDFCEHHQIQLQAHSPFRRGDLELMENTTLQTISARHKRSVAQIILRWTVQRGVSVIPKSVTRTQMQDNLDIFNFSLSTEEMASISALNRDDRVVRFQAAAHLPDYPFE